MAGSEVLPAGQCGVGSQARMGAGRLGAKPRDMHRCSSSAVIQKQGQPQAAMYTFFKTFHTHVICVLLCVAGDLGSVHLPGRRRRCSGEPTCDGMHAAPFTLRSIGSCACQAADLRLRAFANTAVHMLPTKRPQR